MREIPYDNDSSVAIYLKQIGAIPLLTPQRERELAIIIDEGRTIRLTYDYDQGPMSPEEYGKVAAGLEAQNELAERNTRLVLSIAKKYQGRGRPLEDIIQAGNVGLMRAIQHFDYKRGNKFSTYGTWWIRQSIIRDIVENSRSISIPSHANDKINILRKKIKSYINVFHEEPNDAELADATGFPIEKVRLLRADMNDILSLDMYVGNNPDSEEDNTFYDVIPSDDEPIIDQVEARELGAMAEDLVRRGELSEDQLYALKAYYEDDLTLTEIGTHLGCTREWARVLRNKALEKIRRKNNIR